MVNEDAYSGLALCVHTQWAWTRCVHTLSSGRSGRLGDKPSFFVCCLRGESAFVHAERPVDQ